MALARAGKRRPIVNSQGCGLDAFAYIVSAILPAYIAAPRDPDASPIGFYRIGDSARIEMLKGGVISGSVKRANGDPVVSVVVRAYLIRDNKGKPPRYGVPVRARPTDDRASIGFMVWRPVLTSFRPEARVAPAPIC